MKERYMKVKGNKVIRRAYYSLKKEEHII